MLLSLQRRDKKTLSWRSRAFIRIHHLAIAVLIGWIGYLFVMAAK